MGLIQPLALALAAAGLIPLVLHLLVRRRGRSVPFPSLRFLQASPARRLAPGRLTHPLLLASRMLIILLLAFFLARPYLTQGPAARRAGERRVRAVVLDQSASMGTPGTFDGALQAARRSLTELNADDQVALIRYAGEAEVIAGPGSTERALAGLVEVEAPVPSIEKPGSAHGAALLQALRLLQGIPGRQEIVWISDFRGPGFESLARRAAEAGVHWTSVPVEEAARDNDAPAAVRVEGPGIGGEARQLRVSIDRFARDQVHAEEVAWALPDLGDRVLGGTLSDGRGVHVRVSGSSPASLRVQVALDPGDSLVQDDVAAFAVGLSTPRKVAVIGPQAHYVIEALRAAVAVGRLNVVLNAELEEADLVVVTDRSRLAAGPRRSVQEAASRGAALLIGGAVRAGDQFHRLASWRLSSDALTSSLQSAALAEPADERNVIGRFRDGSVAARRGESREIQLAFALTGPPAGPALADGFPGLIESSVLELVPEAASMSSHRPSRARLESVLQAPAPPEEPRVERSSWSDPSRLEREAGLALPLGWLLLLAAVVEGLLARRVAVRS